MFAGCQPEGEDLLHLVVVLDRGVKELSVLGVSLRRNRADRLVTMAMVHRLELLVC